MGTMTFGRTGGFGHVGSTTAQGLIETMSTDPWSQVNLIDTANVYFDGLSRCGCGQLLKRHRDQVLVATEARMPIRGSTMPGCPHRP